MQEVKSMDFLKCQIDQVQISLSLKKKKAFQPNQNYLQNLTETY